MRRPLYVIKETVWAIEQVIVLTGSQKGNGIGVFDAANVGLPFYKSPSSTTVILDQVNCLKFCKNYLLELHPQRSHY